MVAEQKDEARVYLRRSETKQEMSLHDQLRIALGRAAELGVSIQATPADIDHMQSVVCCGTRICISMMV